MNQVVDSGYFGDSKVVPVQSLDSLLGERRPCMLKIDVEGFESSVLEGAANVLSDIETQAILLEADDAKVIQAMRDNGFECVDYDAMNRAVKPLTEIRFLNNNIWVRDPILVEEFCRAARRFSVFGFEF